jgi:hypothetical protein
MTDYQPITDADLEVGSAAPPQAPEQPAGNYTPIKDSDLSPTGPAGNTGEFAYKGIPAAAAARFHASNPLANIFGAAATRYAQSWSYTFADLNAADQKTLIDNGYGNYSGPGALLQHAADAFNAGATLLKNGFLATVSAIPEAGAAVEGQIARETGADEAKVASAEREGGFATMAALSDVNSQIETARVQAASPGVWGHAYRVDDVPPDGAGGGEGLTHTPLGRLPDVEEAKGQAAVVADALHLPPETATLIHQTYLDTGRPPAELLLDAQTNHGGVLDDLVAGKVPTAYGGKAAALPVVDTAEIGRLGREASLNELDKNLADQLAKLPAGDVSAADRLNRLQTVEDQLKTAEGPERKALLERRDQILVDTNPEALNAAAQPLVDRRILEAQRARVAEQLADIERERQAAQANVALSGLPGKGGPSRPVESEGQLFGDTVDNAPTAATLPEPQPEIPPLVHREGIGSAEARGTPTAAPVQSSTTTQVLKAAPAPVLKEPLAPGKGLSKIGLSIEQKAKDQGVTDGFLSTAGYDVKTVKGQTALVSDLITGSPDKMNAIINGEQALPKGIDPSMFIAGVESVVEQTKDWDLAARLANSPVVTRTSEAAQTLRFAQEREPDSAMAKLAELQQAKVKAAGGAEEVAKRQTQAKAVLKESNGVFLPKEELRWDKFLDEIKC